MKNLIALSCAGLLALASVVVVAEELSVEEANQLMQEGKIQSFENLNEKALSLQPGTILETELEEESGRYVYKVDVRTAEGEEWEIELDASNAEVLKNSQDG